MQKFKCQIQNELLEVINCVSRRIIEEGEVEADAECEEDGEIPDVDGVTETGRPLARLVSSLSEEFRACATRNKRYVMKWSDDTILLIKGNSRPRLPFDEDSINKNNMVYFESLIIFGAFLKLLKALSTVDRFRKSSRSDTMSYCWMFLFQIVVIMEGITTKTSFIRLVFTYGATLLERGTASCKFSLL